MHTIALISRKGGTGKSTLAIGLAIAAMERGHKVCLVEADPLGTISSWRARRAQCEPAVETVHDGYALVHRVRALVQRGTTLTIVDTAGGWSDASRAAISIADLCLIPVRPSPPDIEAAAPALAAIRLAGKPFALVLNQTPVRSHRLNDAAAALGETATALNVMGVLALPYIVHRNDQQDALGAGLSITEYAHDGRSAGEIRALWQWLWARLTAGAEAELHPGAAVSAPAAIPAATSADFASEVLSTETGVDFGNAAPANEQADLRAAG
jgi:chromosome partitioning protein